MKIWMKNSLTKTDSGSHSLQFDQRKANNLVKEKNTFFSRSVFQSLSTSIWLKLKLSKSLSGPLLIMFIFACFVKALQFEEVLRSLNYDFETFACVLKIIIWWDIKIQ